MLYMSSQCTNDGNMSLTATFAVGTNLDIAQVQVQNRVAIAQQQLPAEVQQQGITIKKASPDITLVVALLSPDDSHDTVFLSNYATLQIKDEIARLPGVGDINIFGVRDYSMRLWLDPDKLASRSITAGDVITAVREQNVQVAAGIVGAPPLPLGDRQVSIHDERARAADRSGAIRGHRRERRQRRARHAISAMWPAELAAARITAPR
jgi:multidrug efflux pump